MLLRLKWAGLLGAVAMLTTAASAQAASLTVTPNTNLVSPATVQVSGTGFVGNPSYIYECVVGSSEADCLSLGGEAAPTGNLGPVNKTVTETFTGDSGMPGDCRIAACEVRATDGPGNPFASAPITFGSGTEPPPGGGGGPPPGADTVPPETRIKSGLTETDKPKIKFGFEASEPGSSFQCKLKGKQVTKIRLKTFNPCTSPQRYKKLDPGKYKFFVFATDAAGNADPTPATQQFKVIE
jgi:hypothetical protein